MDQQQIDRIRNPKFQLTRRGYEPREVDHFMLELAEWLENGGIDEAGSYAVTRRLERAGETTTRLLTAAQSEADQIVKEAEAEARRKITEADDTSRKRLEQTHAKTKAMVDDATSTRDAINDTISQLREVQRRVLGEIASLQDMLGAAVQATSPAPPTRELPAGSTRALPR
ncbi:MAG: DivIVA domain-containing protein [Solirubrobacteraceae bacterium]